MSLEQEWIFSENQILKKIILKYSTLIGRDHGLFLMPSDILLNQDDLLIRCFEALFSNLVALVPEFLTVKLARSELQLVVSNDQDWPILENSQDWIYWFQTREITRGPVQKKILQACYERLKPGAVCLISGVSRWGPAWWNTMRLKRISKNMGFEMLEYNTDLKIPTEALDLELEKTNLVKSFFFKIQQLFNPKVVYYCFMQKSVIPLTPEKKAISFWKPVEQNVVSVACRALKVRNRLDLDLES